MTDSTASDWSISNRFLAWSYSSSVTSISKGFGSNWDPRHGKPCRCT